MRTTETMDRGWHRLLRGSLLGERRDDRTGVGTLAVFGESLALDLRQGFPAVTTKRLALRPMWGELAGFVRGQRLLREFHEHDCHIWDADGLNPRWRDSPGCLAEGDLGRIYGVQWREWRALTVAGDVVVVDQLRTLLARLREDPFSRRHLVTAFNPGELDQQCLPPCHTMFQCYVGADRRSLDLLVSMRSVDLFLGLPFDVASYATLQHLMARDVGLEPRYLRFSLGDAHVYRNHLLVVQEVLERRPFAAPRLRLDPRASTLTFRPEDAELEGYEHHEPLKAALNTANGFAGGGV